MYFSPKVIGGIFVLLLFLSLPRDVLALTIASQTQVSSDQLITHSVIQELGNNLSGVAGTFTFRVSTAKSNLNQFVFTVQNTRIIDKDNNNSSILPCVPANYNPADPLGGLIFNTVGVPAGFEDVTLDFSCRNYNFIPGHRYLISICSCTIGSASGKMLLVTATYGTLGYGGSVDQFSGGGLRFGNGNMFDTSHNSGSCSGISYKWNDQTLNPSSGCNIWTSAQDDLYFVLTNTTLPPPPPRIPVIFIPGIGGSELKTTQDIVWSKDNGHGGIYSHGYATDEKIWVNQDEAAKLGDDDYFDILRLKIDGVTSEASLGLTGNLTSFGYSEIDSFFEELGYTKGTDYFVFPYDWRLDIRTTKDSLDILVEEAKQKSGQNKVNLVVHSMGGLVARYYISDLTKAAKVNKLIELGVPHLGSPEALKTLMYGLPLGKPVFKIFNIGIAASETRDVFQNLPSAFQLLPSSKYFNFYNSSDKNLPYPLDDQRDIDNNKIIGALNFDSTKTLLTNLSHNMSVFSFGEQFHNAISANFNQFNSIKIYEIVGSSQPTLGQIIETWWITWPVNIIPKRDQVFINGDDTVPLYSASLKSDTLDLSGGATIHYVDQTHSGLVSKNGTAMQTVKSILNEDSYLPVEVKGQKIALEGQHISVDQDADLDIYDENGNHTGLKADGEVETNIPNTFYDSIDTTKHIFVKKTSKKVTAKLTSKKPVKAKVKIKTYTQDTVTKTALYNNVKVDTQTPAQFIVDPGSITSPTITSGDQTIQPSSEVNGSSVQDLTPPQTNITLVGSKQENLFKGNVLVVLQATDEASGSGILKTEYSLDDGQTVNIYSSPFRVSKGGVSKLIIKSTDNLGNEEFPKQVEIKIDKTIEGTNMCVVPN